MITDGGGKRGAALRPLVGREDVLGFIRGLHWRQTGRRTPTVRLARINGCPGAILETADGLSTIAFQPDGAGRIGAIYVVRNPDKLRALEADAPGVSPP